MQYYDPVTDSLVPLPVNQSGWYFPKHPHAETIDLDDWAFLRPVAEEFKGFGEGASFGDGPDVPVIVEGK